ncbi:protein translocase subunit SecF [Parvularcula sp. IMCC14364]|uniref:protein translocase subunit SecF n=1 Tax=Parvularcula sp. IMCC14364 TaxID=3067902 RepID=UPI0027424DAE|nr:protein translocase subunit SecF [Parvularcula sp. IMCC14364]
MGLKLIPEETDIKFLQMRWIAFAISTVAVLASIAVFFLNGLNFGIDFKGGAVVEVGPAEGQVFTTDDLATVRSALTDLGLGTINVSEIGGSGGADAAGGIVAKIELQSGDVEFTEQCLAAKPENIGGDPAEQAQQIATACVSATLKEVLGEDIRDRRVDVVGPAVSGELIQKGVGAIVFAVIAMLAYIWFRFEWQFSLGAIVALIHDVILTVGMFSITQLEFNLPIIAALLTIVGYSMNDTVVVYDRVRENLRKYKKKPLQDLLDFSINQTLSRTVMTSVTTLIALLALFIFGGPVLRGFTAAMIWGVIIGTYSSVFIASPVLQVLGVKREWNQTAN